MMIKKFIIGLVSFALGVCITLSILFVGLKKEAVLSSESLDIYMGYMNRIYMKNYDGECEWTSKNPEIAEVTDGLIIPNNIGETQILCVTDDGKEYMCNVRIHEAISGKYHEKAETDIKWIQSLQLSDGSFSCYELEANVPARINPYFGSYAALAILRNDHKYQKKENIEAFMNWYFSHMNTEKDVRGSIGTIYDYEADIRDGCVVSERATYDYDSADSYSAVFLVLAEEYLEHYCDRDFLKSEKEKIDMLTDLLLSIQIDYYTESKKGSNVKYLMNNMESYQGLKGALSLYKKLWEYDERIDNLSCAIEGFEENFEECWMGDGYYYPVLDGKNNPFYGEVMEWDMLYEYALPQIFPAMFDITDAGDTFMNKVYKTFCDKWNWTKMDYKDESNANQTWSLIAYAAMEMEDLDRVDEYLDFYEKSVNKRSFPFYTGDSVWFVLTCEKAYEYYSQIERLGKVLP